jgi:hypothetical protein
VFERKEENSARICATRAARRGVLFLGSLNTGAISLLSPTASKQSVVGMTGALAAVPLVKALAGSLTMTGRGGPSGRRERLAHAGSLSMAQLLQVTVSMTKLLEICYPNLTKNRMGRSHLATNARAACRRRFVPRWLGICYADRQDRLAAAR